MRTTKASKVPDAAAAARSSPARSGTGREAGGAASAAFDFASLSVDGAPLRRKLAVGSASDPAEGEADRIAERVMRMPAAGPVLQRACAACEKDDDKVRRKETGDGPTEAPDIVHDVLSSGGRPLDAPTRAFMEPRFGHDFSRVRVHDDTRAVQSANAVNARAYTVGSDIVFGGGAYAPNSEAGRSLLAHELAHTLQQDRAGALAPLRRFPGDGMSPPGDCSWARWLVLNGAVITAKAVTDGLGGCRAGDDCIRLAFKIAAASAEIAARVALMATCFKGGDKGHREQLKNKVTMLTDCYDLFNRSNCPQELVAAMAVVVAQIRNLLAFAMAAVALAVVVAAIAAVVAAIIALLDLIVAAIAAAAAAAEGAAMAAGAAALIALLTHLRDSLGDDGGS
jgi:hypothetical protein